MSQKGIVMTSCKNRETYLYYQSIQQGETTD